MDERDKQGRLVTKDSRGVATGVRQGVAKVEVESEADAQKRRDLANEDPLQKELRLKREARQAAAATAAAGATPSPAPITAKKPKDSAY